MKATVYVRLKGEVLDPQGDAVKRALGTLDSKASATYVSGSSSKSSSTTSSPGPRFPASARKMADEMLANPVIEDYDIEVG